MTNKIWIFLGVLCLIFGQVHAAEKVTYYHLDALGSPIAATDENGNLAWKEAYKPYGERLRKEDGGSNSQWYTGKQEDADNGLTYFGARWYDPTIGRFMGIDPVGIMEDNVHSFNRFAYANNNPYKYIDPDGKLPIIVPFILKEVAGEAIAEITGIEWFSTRRALTKGGKEIAGRLITKSRDVTKGAPEITKVYKRPSGATTKAQRESVQGKPCVDCGRTTPRQVADHKNPLVKEYYQTGAIDKTRMRDVGSVQPQCPTCSARQGAEMSRFSRQMKKQNGLE